MYLEKPIARTLEDADAIVEAARAAAAVCAVGYQWHATELLDDVREALAGQQVGLMLGRNFGPTAGRPWFMDQALGGGQILERGSHHIDLQRAIAGEISAVQAVAGTIGLAQDGAPGIDRDAISLDPAVRDRCARHGALGLGRPASPELYSADIIASDVTLALELGPAEFA